MHDILASLRDVEGVVGSFVVTEAGQLVGRDLPAVFDEHTLIEAGARVARLADTFASQGDVLDSGAIRFRDYKLFVRVFPQGCLCVLALADVHLPPLRMGMNVLIRRLSAEWSSRSAQRNDVQVPLPAIESPRSSSSTLPPPAMSPAPTSSPALSSELTSSERTSSLRPPMSSNTERFVRIYRGRKM